MNDAAPETEPEGEGAGGAGPAGGEGPAGAQERGAGGEGPSGGAAPAGVEPITADDVRHVARLARIALDDDEVAHYTEHLAKVLNHARELEALDLDDVPPLRHSYPLSNVLRADEPGPVVDREEVLGQAPDVSDGLFRVPPVLGDAP